MPEETVDVKFLHHWRDRRDRDNAVDYKPGDRASFPHALARRLVADKLAEFPSKKAERAAEAATA